MKVFNRTKTGELGLTLATVLWGLCFAVSKDANAQVPPAWQVGLRFSAAAVLMALLFHRRLKQLNRRTVLSGLLLGVLIFTGYYLQTVALQYTTAGKSAFLTAIYVVLVPFLYWAVRHTKPGVQHLFSAVLCLCGVGLLSLDGGSLRLGLGEVLTLATGVVYAFHIVCMGVTAEDSDPILLTFVQFVVCGALGCAVAGFTAPLPVWDTGSVLSMAYLAVPGTMIPMSLQCFAQKYVKPGKAALLMSLESVFGCLFGILLLGEHPTWKIAGGFVLIFTAMILSEIPLSKQSVSRQNRALKS